MEDLKVTTYRGFSTVIGETTLTQCIEDIRNGRYIRQIEKIEQLVNQEQTKQADNVKKQLPYLTLTGNYAERRLAHSIVRYNPVITIDLDKLPQQELERIRTLIEADEATLACFLTPKRHGFKVFAYLQTPYAQRLRQAAFGTGKITNTPLERHHALMYEACRKHYEELLGVPVDTSGKDISRGFFTSFDVKAYLNTELLQKIVGESTPVEIDKGETAGESPKKQAKKEPILHSSLSTQMEFRRALATTRKTEKYKEGNRDMFLFCLGNRCYKKGLDEKAVQQLAAKEFGGTDFDVYAPIHNAYTYIDKTAQAEARKEEKTPIVTQMLEFLAAHYDIRRNIILDRLEFQDYAEKDERRRGGYRPLRAKDYNSIFLSMQLAGINCFQNYLRAVVDSNYAREFDPFEAYFRKLKPWDGETDYIGQLADTVQAEDREFWHESFRRWLVGMVAGALCDEATNQLVLILYSHQGKGKSSWIRHLLPPELREYYRNGMIDPGNKDDLLLLSTHLLINMEEFEGAKQGDIAGLKRIISQDSVTERKVYDTQADTYVRHASFIASTNNRQCLQDASGNRRFLLSVLHDIDYRTPVNHEGVYAQAVALLESGYRYWYEGDEIENLNVRNERNRMKDPVEESLYVYFRPARPEDREVKWRPAAALLATLSMYGRMQVNHRSQQHLVQVLERDGFEKQVNEHGTTEYEVVEYSPEQVNRNAGRTKQEIKKEEEPELPF